MNVVDFAFLISNFLNLTQVAFHPGRLPELRDRGHAAKERRVEGEDGPSGERRSLRCHRHQRPHHDERSRQGKSRAQTFL